MKGHIAAALHADGRFVPALIAVLVYLAVVALVGLLLVAGAAEQWRNELDGRLTVQLAPPADAEARAGAETDILAVIRALPEVARADLLGESRLLGRLQPWLGTVQTMRDMSLPLVIDIELKPDARSQADAVRARLRALVADAVVAGAGQPDEPVYRLMRSIMGLALLIVVILATTLAAVAVFATHAGLAMRRETIEILHLLGAEDGAVGGALSIRMARSALVAGLVGFALAALTLLAFAQLAVAPGLGKQVAGLSLSPLGCGIVAALPVLAAVIAFVSARLTARRALAAMP